MLSIGQRFPDFSLTGVVSNDLDKALPAVYPGQLRRQVEVVFFWPKDFTFVCPTEIAGFGKLDRDFADRDAQVIGVSTDSEFVHLAWRQNHADLKDLPFPMLSDIKRDLSSRSACSTRRQASPSAPPLSSTRRRHPLRLRHRPQRRPQSGGSPARARCAADRRTLPLQLAEGRRHPEGGLSRLRPTLEGMTTLEKLRDALPDYARDLSSTWDRCWPRREHRA